MTQKIKKLEPCDYTALVEELRALSKYVPEQMCDDNGIDPLERATDAIETLLAERNELMEAVPRDCSKCIHWGTLKTESPCLECWYSDGPLKNWKWRGPKKEG